MAKVNNSLAALQGAFTPYDEVSVFTYNNGPKMQTDFTGGTERTADAGAGAVEGDGARADCITIYRADVAEHQHQRWAGSHIDPNTNSSHGTSILGISECLRGRCIR